MKKAVYWLLVAGLLVLLCSCSSGGGNDTPNDNLGPLTVVLFAASPDHGFASVDSPLRVTLTWNITGGKAPYYYSLDWNGDGEPDWYLNKVFNKTYSVVHDFYPIGTAPYQAILKVTDTDAVAVTSNPVTVTVNTTQTFAIDPLITYVDNDNDPNNAPPATDFVFEAGTPMFFRAGVVSGAQPFEYQWDFNEDAAIDSTIAAPQYTYSYNGTGVTTMKARVIIVDGAGERATYDFLIPLKGKDVVIPPSPSFEIILSTDPAEAGTDPGTGYKLVNIVFQPGSTNPAVPDAPKLGLSVVVNPDPNKAGVPPYEYYWDFENDGAFDSQFPSPTIPYYDDVRKILVNPYALQPTELQKTFIMRCLVIDGSGKRQEEYRVINVRQLTTNPGEFQATPSYGVVGGEYDGKPYANIVDADPAVADFQFPETQVQFRLNSITGSSGSYQYKLDVDNDGAPEVDWTNVAGNSVIETVSFGPTATGTDWPAVGYYPVRLYLRALQVPVTVPPTVLDDLVFDMPVSLVERPATDQIAGSIKARKGHNATAIFDNTNRDLMIMGGAQGTTPLRDVESLRQAVDSDPDTADPITATAHTWLNFERTNALMFGGPHDAYGVTWMLGGANLVSGANNILNSIEGIAAWEIPFNKPWWIGGLVVIGRGTVTSIPSNPTVPTIFNPPPPAGTYVYTPDGQSYYAGDPAPPLIEDTAQDFTDFFTMSSKMTIHNTNRSSPNYGKSASLLGVPVEAMVPTPPPPAPDIQILPTQLSISDNILAAGDTYEIHYNGGIANEMCGNLGYLPLEQAMGQAAFIDYPVTKLSINQAGYVIVGGLHPPGGDVDEVSGRIISFDPGRLPQFIAMDSGNRGMMTERYDGAATFLIANHKLYVIGGRVASGQSVATVEAYDFDSSQWELAPSLNDARSGHVAFLIDDGNRQLIYVAGGAYYPPGGGQRNVVATAEVFNPETGVWSYTLPLAVPTENGAAAVVPSKETLGFVGESAVWYFGGANAAGAETNTLQELIYWTP